ncbi:MAG: oligosaccharide flippase family protein [Chloroflexota bacterium]
MDFIKSKLTGLLSGGLFGSGLLLFMSMTIVNGGNYLFNLILGRWLGPAAFSDLSLIVTIMLMITFVTVTFQLTSAKFSAVATADEDTQYLSNVRHWLNKMGWGLGLLLAFILGAGSPFWQSFFNTSSIWPFIILSVGFPIYFAQGVDRGILQGNTKFGPLAVSYQAEMWVRLIIAILFVWIGWSVNGAVGGITLSFVATWLVARKAKINLPQPRPLSKKQKRTIALFAGPVIIAHLSQILINNSDILIVKRFFEAEEAGLYAALALIGRIVFFATWSVVTVLFPIVAQKHQKGEPHRHLLALSLGLVAVVSGGILTFSYLFPDFIVNILFGEAYLSIAPLLWLYALATSVYALANVIITYRLSTGQGTGSWLAVFGGLTQVIGLWLFHATLRQVVVAQIYIMTTMLLILVIWDISLAWKEKRGTKQTVSESVLVTQSGD